MGDGGENGLVLKMRGSKISFQKVKNEFCIICIIGCAPNVRIIINIEQNKSEEIRKKGC